MERSGMDGMECKGWNGVEWMEWSVHTIGPALSGPILNKNLFLTDLPG